MNYRISENLEMGRFHVEASGPYSIDDYMAMIKALVLDPQWRKGLDVLVDLRRVSFEGMALDDIHQIADAVIALDRQYGAGRCAGVIPVNLYSKASFYKFKIDPMVNVTTRLFGPGEYEQAVRWLDEERENDPVRD